MSKQGPPSERGQEMDRQQQYGARPIELDRGDEGQHQLRWVVVEHPDQSFLLHEDDYILDSHFNPEFDIWEVLIRLEPGIEEEETD
ncbi:hypothetical protein [Haloarchaeobius iranensis]|uniref:Uncharacterized protein n=1 Tax=Haloarchaeobius iranensis TaxID=996166 RepID=A0A1H0B5R5_9EURY|nr:hypothetical protein [Haloarchaeobius iranensis]SDN41007.1 hypothetical protein SAMN05192554_1347 [Haloarchaeobius iranensis]